MNVRSLAEATFIALTAVHLTSVRNHNYLGVTAHLIVDKWPLHLFTLGVLKTAEFFFLAEAQFLFAHNVISVARRLPFERFYFTIC